MTMLRTRRLTKSYAGVQAVVDVDFELPQGQIRALIGPNGAGKTTFVGMLCGRILPTSGQVEFLGQQITNLPAHKRMSQGMAYTFQITSVFSKLSVHENVALAARRQVGNDSSIVNEAVMNALAAVNLQDYVSKIAGDMSYGHQRLLEIAMGLVQSPKLFILDEPTQGLTQSEVSSFIALIKHLSKDTTILLIEHNMDVVMQSADFITVLDGGRLLAEGTPEAIRGNAAVQSAYLGKA